MWKRPGSDASQVIRRIRIHFDGAVTRGARASFCWIAVLPTSIRAANHGAL